MEERMDLPKDVNDAPSGVLVVLANLEFHRMSNKWMLATAWSCLFGFFGVQRPPRQILVVLVRNHYLRFKQFDRVLECAFQ